MGFLTTLILEGGPSGKKLIRQLHDHLLFAETFVYQLPIVGRWFEMYVPRVSSSQPPM